MNRSMVTGRVGKRLLEELKKNMCKVARFLALDGGNWEGTLVKKRWWQGTHAEQVANPICLKEAGLEEQPLQDNFLSSPWKVAAAWLIHVSRK